MARPLRLHIPGMVYHVMSRGNAKQTIFTDDRDYERYLEVLERGLRRLNIHCLGYCLLGNHLHLLLQPNELPVSRLMQLVNSTYCQWFNRRHGRVGHVLQGRYKAVFVETKDALCRVLRYVLMNPVAAGRVRHPAEWRWCSYGAGAGLKDSSRCVDFSAVCRALGFVDRHHFEEAIVPPAVILQPPSSFIVGSAAFVRTFEPLLRPHSGNDAFVIAQRFAARPSLQELFGGALDRESTLAAARRAFDEYAYTLREIGQQVKRPTATIWFWVHRTAPSTS